MVVEQRKAQHLVPFAYLGLALLVVVLVVPSVLRPLRPETSQSAEFSPDAPPDENQDAVVAALQRAQSGTAGSGSGQGQGERTGADVPVADPEPPVLGCRGFGDPPRQTESFYSAPCLPPCPSNDGATWKNVSANEVRIGFNHGNQGASYEGPIRTESGGGPERANDRTYRVLQAYFNQRFNTCGRSIRLVHLAGGNTSTDGNAAAAQADNEFGVFAAYHLNTVFCRDMIRRGLVVACNPTPASAYAEANGQRWGWMTDWTTIDRFTADLLCKQLRDKPASYTDDPTLTGRTRRFGYLMWSSPNQAGSHTPEHLRSSFDDQCGGSFAVGQDFPAEAEADEAGNANTTITRMKAEGVTTIVLAHEIVAAAYIMSAASSQNYYPEWVIQSPYALDFDEWGAAMPPDQQRHTLGLSQWERPRPYEQTDCFAAYKSIDPSGTPDPAICKTVFPDLQQLVNGVQMAGRTLTPQTFRDGMMRIGQRFYPDAYAIGGGYGPGDFTYIDDFGLIWWDPTAIAPETGRAGAYQWVNDGARYRVGEVPAEPVPFFQR